MPAGLCDALPGMHSLTRCDSTSAFVGRGKKSAFQLLLSSQCFEQLVLSLASHLLFRTSCKRPVSNSPVHSMEVTTSPVLTSCGISIFVHGAQWGLSFHRLKGHRSNMCAVRTTRQEYGLGVLKADLMCHRRTNMVGSLMITQSASNGSVDLLFQVIS